MAVSFQLVIDCAAPEPLARFWAAAPARTAVSAPSSEIPARHHSAWRQALIRVIPGTRIPASFALSPDRIGMVLNTQDQAK